MSEYISNNPESESQLIVVGQINTAQALKLIDLDFRLRYENCYSETEAYSTMRADYLGFIFDSEIKHEFFLASAAVDSTVEELPPLNSINFELLSGEGKDFFLGAAIAYQHIAHDLMDKGFDFEYYENPYNPSDYFSEDISESEIKPILREHFSKNDPVPKKYLSIAKNLVKNVGANRYIEFQTSWDRLFYEHPGLFDSAKVNFDFHKIAIGYTIHLIESSLAAPVIQHNDRVIEIETSKFSTQLERTNSVSDIKWRD